MRSLLVPHCFQGIVQNQSIRVDKCFWSLIKVSDDARKRNVTQAIFKYLRGISNGFTEFITNRILHPPIILLLSTGYTYITLGSLERDVGNEEKQK
jgi:hypothetical protein